MPNHCTNILIVKGNKNRTKECFEFTKGENKGQELLFDLQKIIPRPNQLDVIETSNPTPELQEIYKKNIKKYGCKTWYDWSLDNWGTKWNTYRNHQIDNNKICFETAWSAPIQVIYELSIKFNDLTFELRYLDEGDNFSGSEIIRNGKKIDSKYCEYNDIDMKKLKSRVMYYANMID